MKKLCSAVVMSLMVVAPSLVAADLDDDCHDELALALRDDIYRRFNAAKESGSFSAYSLLVAGRKNLANVIRNGGALSLTRITIGVLLTKEARESNTCLARGMFHLRSLERLLRSSEGCCCSMGAAVTRTVLRCLPEPEHPAERVLRKVLNTVRSRRSSQQTEFYVTTPDERERLLQEWAEGMHEMEEFYRQFPTWEAFVEAAGQSHEWNDEHD